MHSHPQDPPWQHDHRYDAGNEAAERGTRQVLVITLLTMVVEIVAGLVYGSMALLADGIHMSSHALAIGLSALAYASARRLANDPRYAFGTWKIEVLAGYTSAVLLVVVALMMAVGSVERLLSPEPIRYVEAMVVAGLGLGVNLVCALILGGAHGHGHGHGHSHGHSHGHGHGHGHAHGHAHDPGHPHGQAHDAAAPQDLNLRSAYVHVLTDAATSVLALVALAAGWLWGWSWLDPVLGLVGAGVVLHWSRGLLSDTSRVLLDREMDHPVVDEVREVIVEHGRGGATRLTDLHVWRIGRASHACSLVLVTDDAALTPAEVHRWLAVHEEIVHATIEIHVDPQTVATAA
ncbi:CDF family Co(II)/Ni(II) efflux transporter DmeF [Leptothrix discophora]|uniref:CDF family Co(II)/Ni(II) efflux transporter DmeF n=1 Tax=Leptothrix discophora TaxID=89 RepID=A0ABT9G8M5_LEPDI|nr:CDF family Co(II)/Ni(II) efflux transporter DmeF [Leptothrix discophora]MDP4302825.1 CDF family Co(II)/Ni(II) efflux transporter DmeF [Leptothrix discophora]